MNPTGKSRMVIGGVLVLLGIAVMLMNIGMIEHVHFWRFWPLILVVLGLSKLLQPDGGRNRWDGIWLVLLGAWFQVVVLHAFGFTFLNSWPVILIIFGLSLSGRALTGHSHMTFEKEKSDGH